MFNKVIISFPIFLFFAGTNKYLFDSYKLLINTLTRRVYYLYLILPKGNLIIFGQRLLNSANQFFNEFTFYFLGILSNYELIIIKE